ncbi:hypothetical protein FF38_12020 [Lucilia cuprina]|uniref:F5/8 type C domain-containing protein n=1 Tax=Lucilia cuprina TaxID=7375 RepID=A0A0L0CEZ8_LUCCU|nr:hypothetical protein FF38_12020 [Lucilia cuprina]
MNVVDEITYFGIINQCGTLSEVVVFAQCKHPLGMESGAIADFQITASTAHDMGNVGPQHARML